MTFCIWYVRFSFYLFELFLNLCRVSIIISPLAKLWRKAVWSQFLDSSRKIFSKLRILGA